MNTYFVSVALLATSLSSAVLAQAPNKATSSSGSTTIESTQSTRFSNEFNPAFSFIIDATADYASFNGVS